MFVLVLPPSSRPLVDTSHSRSCRAPVGLKELYKLDAFEPNDFELATETGDDSMQVDADDIDETLGGFIVDDDEEDNGPKKKKSSSSSTASKRRVITDSDEEHSEAEEVPEPGSSRQGKGKEKEKAALEIGWMKEVRLLSLFFASSKLTQFPLAARAFGEDALGARQARVDLGGSAG